MYKRCQGHCVEQREERSRAYTDCCWFFFCVSLSSRFPCSLHREAMMIYRPSSPPASSRTSPLALRSSAKPSCCRRVRPGERWRAWSQGGCEKAGASELLLAWPRWDGCNEVGGGKVGSGGKGSQNQKNRSLVLLLRRPLCPPPCPAPTPAIDYIQFLHKEKKKQEEEVSTLRKDVMALKIMKV